MRFTMMFLSLLSLTLAIVGVAANERHDFLRAMDEVTQQKRSLEFLQSKLLEHSIPRRSLANAAADDDGSSSLDLTKYALKYLGCQNIKSFSDDLAQDEDSKTVLALNKFVVFRLCQADKCSTYNKYGCMYNFGEYVIDMEMYLAIMAEYHYQKFLEYCATCIDCMTPPDNMEDDYVYQANQVYNMTDDAYNATFNASANVAWNAAYDCEYYHACKNYGKACKNYHSNMQYNEDDNQYLQCTEFVVGNENVYIGPHCGSDGYTLTLGIFQDNECTELIGDHVDFAYYTGLSLNDDLSFYSNPTCVSCKNSNAYALYSDDTTAQQPYELCEVLYEASAKCNRYLDVSNVGATYTEDTELKVCNFVESLIENNYDESGEIMARGFDMSNWMDIHEYAKVVKRVAPVQIFGLVMSSLLVVGLFIYAAYLHAKVTRIWRPVKIYPKYPAEDYDINRAASGITMMRSGTWAGKENE